MKKLLLILSVFIASVLVATALFGDLFISQSAETIDLANKFAPASHAHLLGTDHLGRDVFARLIYGAKISLLSVFATLFLIIFTGLVIGSYAGLAGGKTDLILMRLCDVFFSVPTIILSLFLVGILGTGLSNVIIAIAVSHWAWYARMVRSIVLGLKTKEYVLLSRTGGASDLANYGKNIFRAVLAQCLVLATLDIGHIMLHVCGLSFLGLGVQPPTPEWGIMISDAKDYIFTHPELLAYPGFAIFLSVMSFNIIGDYVRDRLGERRINEHF